MIKTQTARSRWLATAAAVSMLGLAASSANASEPQQSADASDTNVSASIDNGVRVYIDPKTHKVRQPTPEERAAEAKATTKTSSAAKGTGYTVKTYANGTRRYIATDGQLMEQVVVSKNADGKFDYSFVEGDGTQESHETAPAQTMEEK